MTRLLDPLLPRTRQRVLAAVLMHPDQWWYVRDLARHLGIAPSHARKELQALAGGGLLERRAEGRQVYFRANRRSPIFEELRRIVRKTAGLVDIVREALEPLRSGIQVAFVYGSVARGEETTESDVDLFVVGDVDAGDLAVRLRAAEQELLRPVNPTVFRRAELRRRVAEQNHFVRQVLDSERLIVVGTEDDLAAATR